MNPVAETAVLLSFLVRSMVTDREAVQTTQVPFSGGTCFKIQVAHAEVGKLIGKDAGWRVCFAKFFGVSRKRTERISNWS